MMLRTCSGERNATVSSCSGTSPAVRRSWGARLAWRTRRGRPSSVDGDSAAGAGGAGEVGAEKSGTAEVGAADDTFGGMFGKSGAEDVGIAGPALRGMARTPAGPAL